ncbi:MAG: hypothetical protein ACKVLJ_02445 [Cytophagales bacterium]|jgi:hypothetical protein|tara:strand:- start:2164 stop:3828 length:1665 start_codon:yes stop_codon:yes gene_type:complete
MIRAFIILASFFLISCTFEKNTQVPTEEVPTLKNYKDLTALFEVWRSFENPPLFEGAPDYRAETFKKRNAQFIPLRNKLISIDTLGWPIEHQVDWHVIWAEMNGYDFNQRVLKPWARDPAFYVTLWLERSDVPGHEGPTHHKILDLWTYHFPLSKEDRARIMNELKVIPAINRQAEENLTGNAKDLWITGIKDIRTQSVELSNMLNLNGVQNDSELVEMVNEAILSTDQLVEWLEEKAVSKTGPSGIGKESYTWYQQNVHLVPLTWEDEVMILKRELARAWTALKLEEHRNRDLPPLSAADSPEAYEEKARASAKNLMTFLEENEILTVKDYFSPALNKHLGAYIPESTRNFFMIGAHYDPRPLYSHFYHWFELAIMDRHPPESPLRQGPLLYNIFDSRNEGTATAVEEMFMQVGLYDQSPRVREIVYIMIAQRAARGLGSLYAHANEMTMEEAGGIHSEFTPRGWMKTEKELLIFEQHLYLRQPGYGSSYITGKYLLEQTFADYAKMKSSQENGFVLRDFFDELNAIGSVPISLTRWEMTGLKPILNKSKNMF